MEILAIVGGVVALVAIVLYGRVALVVATQQRAAVISQGDGEVRLVRRGRAWRWPLFQEVGYLDMRSVPLELSLDQVYSQGMIPLDVEVRAAIRVATDPGVIENAVPGLVSRTSTEIGGLASVFLEGSIRSVVSGVDPEEILADRRKVARSILDDVTGDLLDTGLEVEALEILRISDRGGYLEGLARARTEQQVTRLETEARIQAIEQIAVKLEGADSEVRWAVALQLVPELMERLAEIARAIDIERITLVDVGDGGQALADLVAGMPAAAVGLVQSLREATGIDVVSLLRDGADMAARRVEVEEG